MFATEHLDRMHNTGVKLQQQCNAGATTTGKMGYWHGIKIWVNEAEIANLLSVPQLEKDGYKLAYDTESGWDVCMPAGNTICFKKDAGICAGMSYIN